MKKEEFKACTKSIGNTNAYVWCRKYQKVTIGGKILLCNKPSDDGENENIELA